MNKSNKKEEMKEVPQVKLEPVKCKKHGCLPNWVVERTGYGFEIATCYLDFPHEKQVLKCPICELEKQQERIRPEIEKWNKENEHNK